MTEQPIDIISGFQIAGHPDADFKKRIAKEACPGYGSCGGMFTYNTMQTFIGVVGMQPLHMVAPPSDDPRRLNEFPEELVGYAQVDPLACPLGVYRRPPPLSCLPSHLH